MYNKGSWPHWGSGKASWERGSVEWMGLIGGQVWLWPMESLCLRNWKKPGRGSCNTRRETRAHSHLRGLAFIQGFPAAPGTKPQILSMGCITLTLSSFCPAPSYISPSMWLLSAARLHQAHSCLRSMIYSSSAQDIVLPSQLARVVSSAHSSSYHLAAEYFPLLSLNCSLPAHCRVYSPPQTPH